MSQPNCEGADVSCVGGYLYTSVGMMIFPTNKRCPHCHPETQASPRATVLSDPLRITINSIPHDRQRYDTCGDYYEAGYISAETGEMKGLEVRVSQLADRREMLLVAIHELCEWALCQAAGISNEAIDQFDLSQEHYFEGEPGDQPTAPYYKQHQIATGIERILAAEMGVDWLEYERHIEELSNGK